MLTAVKNSCILNAYLGANMKDFQALLKAFADDVGFVKFQIESFNDFAENRLQKIIDSIGEIKPEVPEIGELVIKFGKLTVGDPSVKEADGSIRKIFPMEARLRDLTYAAPLYVEMTPIVNKKEQETVDVLIGNLPIMVKSKFCPLSKKSFDELEAAGEDPYDTGGYFIINGTERVVISIEEIAPNRMILDKKDLGSITETIRVNSEKDGFVQRHLIERKNDGTLYISFASVKRLPLVVLLKVLGLESDKEIISSVSEDAAQEVYANLYSAEVASQREAVEYVGSHLKIQKETRKERVEQIVDKYMLPHLGQDEKSRAAKALYLAKAMEKIILLALNKIPEDDLDHYSNKRLKMCGGLLELMIRSILIGRWGLVARISYNYQKLAKRGKLPPVQTIVEANVVTNQLISALATGAWVGGRTGVSQRLERANFVRSVSHLRSVISPLTSTQEHFEARELHATHFGRLCPAETPEGPTIGLRKYLALMAEITHGLSESEKKKIKIPESGKCTIYLDGVPKGGIDEPEKFVEEIRRKRRSGLVSHEINVAHYQHLNEIRINTDSGRIRRPLIILENGKPKLTAEHLEKIKNGSMKWDDLINSGILEYLDAEEEDNAFVAVTEKDVQLDVAEQRQSVQEKHTHLELSPLAVLGLSASLIAFPEHNRGDRVNYGAKMANQAIGLYQANFFLRSDTKANVLNYPQTSIVETETVPVSGLVHHPAGQNIIVAMMTHHGYNMHDAVVMNRSSIERGMMRSFFYRLYSGEEKRYWGGQEDVIGIPDKDVKGYKSEEAYAILGEDGIINIETPVTGESILIGRTSPLRFLSSTAEFMTGISNRRDTSVSVRHGEKGVAYRIFLTETVNGNKLVKVAVRDERIPEIGDKFASRHGQKGVIGLIVDGEDMPFTAEGIVPDLIFNPHSVPSRQTIGQLLETLAGKAGALHGKKIDASFFSETNEEGLRKILKESGFRSDGKETMYNGVTGEKFEVEIFLGPLYYQKLDHMVADKIHARSRGPVALLTKQPTEGRAKEGGLRLGEMEKDCLIAHGAVLTLKERFSSDRAIVPVCKNCGLIAIYDKNKDKKLCPVCKDSEIIDVEMSYAFKLMLDELKTMLIYPKINPAS